MRHALVAIVLLVLGYVVWHLLAPFERRNAARILKRHGFRLVAIVATVLVLLAVAFHFGAISIL